MGTQHRLRVWCGLLAAVLAGGAVPGSGGDLPELPPAVTRPVDLARDIVPLLEQRCLGCHAGEVTKGGLRLDTRAAALAGGNSGPVIEVGHSGESRLIDLVAGREGDLVMPPQGPRLTRNEIALLRGWIDQGLRWPDQPLHSKPLAGPARSPGKSWALQPLGRPPLPRVADTVWVRNPLDAFVRAPLERDGLAPSPEADRGTLLRRVTLDLTGLLPTPEELAAYLADPAPDAYERAVDRLLASPHFGEKWARHWLDQARYADSDGFEKDLERPHAWRYRQWVIEALNRDLPFDQFTIEQLAGDLLPHSTLEQRVATGFNRNTLTNREGGSKPEQFRFEQIVDRTNTLGTVWLGWSFGCAQCHDHKYDPLTQREYYQVFAFFNTSQEINLEAPLPGEAERVALRRGEFLARRQQLLDEYGVPPLQPGWERELQETAAHPGVRSQWDIHYERFLLYVDHGQRILNTPPEQRTFYEADAVTKFFIQEYGAIVFEDRYKELKFEELKHRLEDLEREYPAPSLAPTLAEEPQPHTSHVHLRGDFYQPGVVVQPATPQALHPFPDDLPRSRLGLARWLMSPDNPVTPRVAANRVWQELFGRGLVRTSEDFGNQGERPSHPELLDWLAVEFRDGGWSVKRLLRLMVTSATYRQSSQTNAAWVRRDPQNLRLARQSRLRLPAELIRDVALQAGDVLVRQIGGRSIRPPQPEGVADLGFANKVHWTESPGADRYRRGLYIHFQRTIPYPQLMTFDAPDANVTACRRGRSNTPLQALNLWNDPVFVECARGLAGRICRTGSADIPGRVDAAYRIVLARTPSTTERARLVELYRQAHAFFLAQPEAATLLAPPETLPDERAPVAAWVAVARVVLNLDEAITRE